MLYLQAEIKSALKLCNGELELAIKLLDQCFESLTSTRMTQLRLQGKAILLDAMQTVYNTYFRNIEDPTVLNEVVTNAPAAAQVV